MTPLFRTIQQLLVEGRPEDHPVALHDNGLVSWSDFNRLIEARQANLPPTVILSDQSPLEFIATMFAGIRSGRKVVIPPNFQPQTLADLAAAPPTPAHENPTLDIYTSGTTGLPKIVGKTLRQLETECRVLESCWGELIGQNIVVATTPHHHIYGLIFRLLWPLCAGRAFDCTTIAEPTTLKERLSAAGNAILVSSPAQLSRLPELLALENLSPRPSLVFSSGGPLLPAHAQRYAEAWGSAPIEVFGSTETGGVAWRQQRLGDTAWSPLPTIQVSQDNEGALLLRSPFLPDDMPFCMADRIARDDDGRFRLLGRLDRIVKIEEKRLSLPEMEEWLSRHPAIASVVLAAVPAGNRQVVGAVVVLHSTAGASRRAVIDHLRSHLAERFDRVLFPRKWRFVDHLPLNERGKLASSDVLALLETKQ
jgi:acyl-coenzyme A synthetase/AMP-(fatty) acid ligase